MKIAKLVNLDETWAKRELVAREYDKNIRYQSHILLVTEKKKKNSIMLCFCHVSYKLIKHF